MENKNIWLEPVEENITHHNEEFAALLKEINTAVSDLETIKEHIDKLVDFFVSDIDNDETVSPPLDILFEFADNCGELPEIIRKFRAMFFGSGIDWRLAQKQLENFFPIDDDGERERIRHISDEIQRKPDKGAELSR